MSEKKDFGEILTLQETAEFLQLSRATVYSYAQKGKLPGVKMGNKWRFSKKKLEDIIYTGQGIKRQGKVTYTERDEG
jgi:excisionase family DNA binding protein